VSIVSIYGSSIDHLSSLRIYSELSIAGAEQKVKDFAPGNCCTMASTSR
jgi:hypothetical protein